MLKQFRHGKEPTMAELADLTFNDIYNDGEAIKDKTFEDLQNAVWSTQSKNSGTTNLQTKN